MIRIDRKSKRASQAGFFYSLACALIGMAPLLLSGCAKKQLEASYYLIEFVSTKMNADLKGREQLPFKVQATNFKIPRSYDSIRIIARYSSHRIDYYRYSLWAVRPNVAVADLIVQQINAYDLFKDCQREFLNERPDYEITGEILQIERFESETYSAAHLKMEFELYGYDSRNILVRHTFDREAAIPAGNMSIFAKAISDIIEEESEAFLVKVMAHFDAGNDSLSVGR